jgi:membrane protease YdiL (CAAX protease family)
MWNRLPIWFRAVVTGLVVSGLPSLLWGAMANLNLRLDPRIAWSVPVMTIVLWIYWRYLERVDRERLRAKPLRPRVWRLALLAGGAAVAALWALFAVVRGMLPIAAPVNQLPNVPVVTVIAAILIGSAVAAIGEEAGFRGFMQLPLERAYGPVIAIATTSILFSSAHLSHGRRILPLLPLYFLAGVVYGLLTYFTGSILPSLILHFAGDVTTFSMRYVAAREGAIAATGTISIPPIFAFVAFAASSVLLFRLLVRATRDVAQPTPAVA